MRRQLLIANLVIIVALLVALEVPLALIYSRHEHDALTGALQRDASSVATLTAEILERPGPRDVASLAQRYASESSTVVVVIGPDGQDLTPSGLITEDPSFVKVIQAARSRGPVTGEIKGLLFASQALGADRGIGGTLTGPVDSAPGRRGVVLVARSDESVDQRVQRFWMLLGLLAAGVLIVSLAVSSRLGRWVADPLRRLEGQAARLGAGDLEARADPATGPPEVGALASAFNDMADRLNELVRSQRRFVADASHQLRGPLTALRLRLENLDGRNPIDVDTTRDAALAETTRMTRLVDGLLSLARAEGHRPEREPVDIRTVVAERRDAWAPLAAEHGVEVRMVNVDSRPLRALIVAGHLEQILDNLVDNALDASPPGTAIELCILDAGSRIEVHVTDAGRGMSDTDRARAFDPFWQGPSTQANGGTGLGLAIAAQLARASQGSIALDRSAAGGVDAAVEFPTLGG